MADDGIRCRTVTGVQTCALPIATSRWPRPPPRSRRCPPGGGRSPRHSLARGSTAPRLFGGQNMTGKLRRVLVRPPAAAGFATWREYGWRSEPDVARLAEEHEAFCNALGAGGAEVVVAETALPADPDAIYVFDPAIVSEQGAIVLRPGKEGRLVETDAIARDLEHAGVPIAARLGAPACADGGDTIWLDHGTLLVGRGYRTNDNGIQALRKALPGVGVLPVRSEEHTSELQSPYDL